MLNKNLETNKSLYWKFNANDGMMYSTPWPWNGPYTEFSGAGDALIRTSLTYIAYKDSELKQSILKCFRKFTMIDQPNKYWYQASRCSNRYREDDVSRDQVILALSSLAVNKDFSELKEITQHLPFKLSRRFNMSLTMWVWVKYLQTDKKIWSDLHHIFNVLELIIAVPLTKFLRKKAKVDKYMAPGTFISDSTKNSIWYRIYNKIQLPGYALHLKAWQYYTSNKKGAFATLNRALMLSDVESDNYLMQELLGNCLDSSDYKSISNWRPHLRLNGDNNGTVWYLKESEIEYNQLDKDILNFSKK